MDSEGYCMKCKTKRTLVNARLTQANRSGGRLNLKGQCSVCGRIVNKLVARKKPKVEPRVEPKVEVEPEVAQAPPAPEYKAYCRWCRDDRPVVGGQIMKHFSQGTVIAGGECTGCGRIGMFVKAVKLEEEAGAEF